MLSILLRLIEPASNAPRSAGCVGKLPGHADFLRRNADLPEAAALQYWIGGGLQATQVLYGRFWDTTYDLAPPARLFYSSLETGRRLCGFLLASADRVGRRHPFLVFRRDEDGSGPPSLAESAAASGEFFASAREAASLGHRPGSRGEFLARVETLGAGAGRGRCCSLDGWLSRRTLGEFLAAGELSGPGRFPLFSAVLAARDAGLSAWRALRLPPCETGGDLGFWLKILEGNTDREARPRLVLWSESLTGRPTRPLVFRAPLEAGDFRFFLDPSLEDRWVLDPAPRGTTGPRCADAARERLGGALDDTSGTLRDLLCALDPRALAPARRSSRTLPAARRNPTRMAGARF